MVGILERLARIAVPTPFGSGGGDLLPVSRGRSARLSEWACMTLPTHPYIYEAAITEAGKVDRKLGRSTNTQPLPSGTFGNRGRAHPVEGTNMPWLRTREERGVVLAQSTEAEGGALLEKYCSEDWQEGAESSDGRAGHGRGNRAEASPPHSAA